METKSGLARFFEGKWQVFGEESGVPKGEIHSLLVDREGTLWAAVDTRSQKPSCPMVFLRHGARRFQVPAMRTRWRMGWPKPPMGRSGWLKCAGRCAPLSRQVRPRLIAPEIRVGALGVCFDRDGTLWIATAGDGLRRARDSAALGATDIAQQSDAVDKFTQRDGLTSDVCLPVFEDREGNIWGGYALRARLF